MEKISNLTDTEKVTALIQQLDAPFAGLVERIRQVILSTDQEISEQVKWNSPAFYYSGVMKPFDPKTYKRDIVVMNLRNSKVLLVFPTGATIPDRSGILEGSYADGRRVVNITGPEDAAAKESQLKEVILEWLKLVEK